MNETTLTVNQGSEIAEGDVIYMGDGSFHRVVGIKNATTIRIRHMSRFQVLRMHIRRFIKRYLGI